MTIGSKPLRLGLRLAALFQGSLKTFPQFAEVVRDRSGLEIGGPSKPFREAPLPIYDLVKSLDNCNYSASTIWSQHIGSYRFSDRRPPGKNLISDATDLSSVKGPYDFILSSHNLEHIANPLKALLEWKRISPDLILIVPDGSRTFDRFRPITSVEHMLEDYTRGCTEEDATHFEEVIALHDVKWGFHGNRAELEKSVRNNFNIRTIHHHVFNEQNIRELLILARAKVKVVERAFPHHICVLAEW